MSHYGIHFGVVDMPNGESRMVMVDEQGAWSALARKMGFAQSRWFGLYVKSSLKLDIPGFRTNFPSAKVIDVTGEEIRRRILPLILQRKNQRLSQMSGGRRLSWHPRKDVVGDSVANTANAAEPGEVDGAINAEAALRQTLYLGMNFLGQEVFESGDGQRFVRSGDTVLAREASDTRNDPVFLRAVAEDDLIKVAAGMVNEIVSGKRLGSDDFVRFVEAAGGPNAADEKDNVTRFHVALDGAMRERVASVTGAGRDAFDEALRLHEGRPTYWRAPGSMSTPLPLAVLMQSLAAARAQTTDSADPPTIVDITSHPGSHSWSLNASSISGAGVPPHDICLAGVFGRPTSGQQIGGIRVTRSDTEQLLASLAQRADDGLSVFLMTTPAAGRLDSEFRRVLSAIGQRYEMSGLVDVDAAMIGPANEYASRLIVIGRKRENPDLTFAVPSEIPVIYDYDSLWNWGEALRAAAFGESQTFGDDDREANRWQAPYIPASQISEPSAMSPRNLLGPVRKALAKIVERTGLGIDELVCDRLGWTLEELADRLDAEQADAVAIGMMALDDGKGFTEADATGLGKGRVAAALALYAKRKGMPVMFMTEKADLFSDFYRDVQDIGALGELGAPFIVNNDLVVSDAANNVIARSPTREVASTLFACGERPEGSIVLATYSQFNREYTRGDAPQRVRAARALRDLMAGAIPPFEAMNRCAPELLLPDYVALGFSDVVGAASLEENNVAACRAKGDPEGEAAAADRLSILRMDTQQLVERIGSAIKTDLTTLKHQWLHSGAMAGALVILDESHVAAGETSNTGDNLRVLVEQAGAVAYSSATFAKDVGNFLLYSRLFPPSLRASSIGATLARGGEPMQEILSAMLAEDGRLVRREHDLSNIEFKLSVDTDRLERNEIWANGFATVLAALSQLSGEISDKVNEMNKALNSAVQKAGNRNKGAKGPVVGVHYTNFSSKFYNLTRAFMLSVNADFAADCAIKALREGRKPVITVENTMESVLRELVHGVELDRGDAAPEVSPAPQGDLLAGVGESTAAKPSDAIGLGRSVSFRDILLAYTDAMFGAIEQKRQGNRVISSKRLNLLTPELQKVADEVRLVIAAMPEVPLSPLDLVRQRVEAAGFSIDEISGRRLRLERTADGTDRVVRMSARKKQALKSAFNGGQLDALILSKSGSTGISLHASRTFADQSQRELIELQPAADIAQRLQFWGRVNRKGQVCSPVVHMISSGLPGELRLIVMQNAKLRRLSANISGNADNSAINEDAPDILNRVGNEVCFRWMEARPEFARRLDFKIDDLEKVRLSNTRFVDMLTGKVVMFHVPVQRQIYAEITAEFHALLQQYEMDGVNPLKSTEYDLRAKKTANVVMQVPSGFDSVFDNGVNATELTYDISLPALDRATLEAEAKAGHERLVQEFGKKYFKAIPDEIEKLSHASLPALLPQRFLTVEQALADEGSNAVKNARSRMSWLTSTLGRMAPGSLIGFGDERFAGVDAAARNELGAAGRDSFYITGWRLPEDNKLSLGAYRLEGYSLVSRKKMALSLSALHSRTALWVEVDANKSSAYDAGSLKGFFDVAGAPINGSEKRVVLDGNLFRAAEMAEGRKQGTSITYTDEKGVWRHAILMPRQYDIDTIQDLPIIVDSADTLAAALASDAVSARMPLVVTDDFREKSTNKATYKLWGRKDRVFITLWGNADKAGGKHGWLLHEPRVKDFLKDGDFKGSRAHREAVIMPGKEEAFVRFFFDAASRHGVTMMMDGGMRDWHNDYMRSLTGQPTAASMAMEVTLPAAEDDELNALLAAPAV